jgi:hypothetical protein
MIDPPGIAGPLSSRACLYSVCPRSDAGEGLLDVSPASLFSTRWESDLAAHQPPFVHGCRDVALPSHAAWRGSRCRSIPPSPTVSEQAEEAETK